MMAMRGQFAFTDPEATRQKCQEYFDSLARTRLVEVYDPEAQSKVWKEMPDGYRIPGIAGLSAFLGIDRRSFLGWCKRADSEDETIAAISHVLRAAKVQIEAAQEEALFDRDTHRGAAFSLAVNYDWGKEEEKRPDEAFQRQIIPPVADGVGLAIPKWKPEGDDDDG